VRRMATQKTHVVRIEIDLGLPSDLPEPVLKPDPHRRCHGDCWQSLRVFGHAPRGLRPDHDFLINPCGPGTCPSCGALLADGRHPQANLLG
jgi:hypothetical protein